MLEITFGAPERAQQAIERINAIHAQVHGTLQHDVGVLRAGTPYSATDPKLLLWVHATLLDSMMLTYESLVTPLASEERDRFCAEAAETGVWLGIPDAMLPMTAADLMRYMTGMYESGEIAIGPDARALADALFSPPLGPATRLFRITRLITAGLLPPAIRAGYGLPWDDSRARTCRRLMTLIRRVRRLLPPVLREWPIARAA
jgi:uncharacterized protein (DUF2236 family)